MIVTRIMELWPVWTWGEVTVTSQSEGWLPVVDKRAPYPHNSKQNFISNFAVGQPFLFIYLLFWPLWRLICSAFFCWKICGIFETYVWNTQGWLHLDQGYTVVCQVRSWPTVFLFDNTTVGVQSNTPGRKSGQCDPQTQILKCKQLLRMPVSVPWKGKIMAGRQTDRIGRERHTWQPITTSDHAIGASSQVDPKTNILITPSANC